MLICWSCAAGDCSACDIPMDGEARSVGLCLALWRSGKRPCGLGGYLPDPSRHFSLKGQAAAPSSSHPYWTEVQGGDCGVHTMGSPTRVSLGSHFNRELCPQVLWGLLVIHPEWQNPAKAGVCRKESQRMGSRIGALGDPVLCSEALLHFPVLILLVPCPALPCCAEQTYWQNESLRTVTRHCMVAPPPKFLT